MENTLKVGTINASLRSLLFESLFHFGLEVCFEFLRYGPTWHEVLCAILLGFEAWKFDTHSVEDIALQ